MSDQESPCTGICQMDDVSGYCLGCGRTIEEIIGWGSATSTQKKDTLDKIPARQPADKPASPPKR
jgi:uncharacterized protein